MAGFSRELFAPACNFAVVNLGCKVNRVESDSIAARLLAAGGMAVRQQDADVIVINSCTVTGEADKKTRKSVRAALRANPHAAVVVTGCGVTIDPQVFVEMSPRVAAVERTELFALLEDGGAAPLRFGDDFRTRVNIKVQDGCDHACTYCIVHVARGPAMSMGHDDVLREARAYFESGAKELVLAGIDLGSYRSGGWGLAELVTELLEAADSACGAGELPARVRASSIEPRSVDERFVDLLAGAQGRLCRHLHLPLQAGSSRVLREMARPYTADYFVELVEHLYERVPSLSLTTDIICGFPGETDDDFEQTLENARRCRFSKIHVFPYSRREGTPAAAREDQVAPEVKALRAARLRALSDELRAQDLARRSGTAELALVEPDVALTESYHELPVPAGARAGELTLLQLQ